MAVHIQSETEDEIRDELRAARDLMWNAACAPLHLVWYEGNLDISQILEEYGFASVSADFTAKSSSLKSSKAALTLFNQIGQYREDVAVFLGYDGDCLNGIRALIGHLQEAQFHSSAWRLTI